MLVLSLLKFYILIIHSHQYLCSYIIKICSILKADKLEQEMKITVSPFQSESRGVFMRLASNSVEPSIITRHYNWTFHHVKYFPLLMNTFNFAVHIKNASVEGGSRVV